MNIPQHKHVTTWTSHPFSCHEKFCFSGITFGNQKRNFDEIDRSGFNGFVKKNFDEIDRSGFDGFVKKNFDEIDRVGFGSFVKRNAPQMLLRSNDKDNH